MNISKELLKLENSSKDLYIKGLLSPKGDETEDNLRTFRPPPSSVLSKVKDFLPEIGRENEKLEKMIENNKQEEIDIENVDNCDGRVIEMNLALFQADSDCDDSGISDSDSDSSDSSEDSAIVIHKGLGEDNFKIKEDTNRRKPIIVDAQTPQTNTTCSSDVESQADSLSADNT